MLRDDPKDAFLRYAMSLELSKMGRLHDAVAALESLHADEPTYLPLYYQLGKFYEASGRQEDAAKFYESGVEIAMTQREIKTLAELREALQQVD